MKRTLIGAVIALLGLASAASAQDVPILWDTPSFMGPNPGSDLGFYVIDVEDSDIGFQGIWRTDGSMNLGLRAGWLDTPGDGVLVLGAETWGGLVEDNPDFPLDVSWTAGAGAWLNGTTVFAVPVGVSIGKTVDLDDSMALQIYGHPRIGLVLFEDVNDDLEADLEGQFDLGADLYVSPSVALKLGISLGNADAIGFGLSLRQ